MKIINKTKKGKAFICDRCNAIHLEFGNFAFNFSEKQYLHFANYVQNLDGKLWEKRNTKSMYTRKIIIPIDTGHAAPCMLLHLSELNELKQLISVKPNKKIDFRMIKYTQVPSHNSLN